MHCVGLSNQLIVFLCRIVCTLYFVRLYYCNYEEDSLLLVIQKQKNGSPPSSTKLYIFVYSSTRQNIQLKYLHAFEWL